MWVDFIHLLDISSKLKLWEYKVVLLEWSDRGSWAIMASVKVLYIKNKNITSCWKSNSICDLWICDMDLVKKCSQQDQL